MDKIFKTLDSVNSFSKKIILFASIFVVIGCISGISVIMYNHAFVNEVELYNIGTSLIKNSTTVFAQLVIGALIMDWFKNAFQNDD